jgi:glycosyltransferase involved in cell wall biosynthesis
LAFSPLEWAILAACCVFAATWLRNFRGMNVLVYPHSMELGGSQLNALQVAGAIRDRGHRVIVISERGPLVARVAVMGLEHIEIPPNRARPSPGVTRMLGDVVRRYAVDVVHGHEWPPIVEAFLGVDLPGKAALVGTVMSMSVAPFLPRSVALTVGTEMIREAAIAAGHRHVTLLEPPVDTLADNPSMDGNGFRVAKGIGPDEVLVVMVCRLVPDLKLEGLLSACSAVGEMALNGVPARLMVIGDGPAHAQVAVRAAEVNASVGHQAIILAGSMADPRPGYAAGDIIIGQGGSALRGMAFGKPLVVIGEDGFSELLTPESAPTFLRQGWYGLGPGSRGAGTAALQLALEAVVSSPARRRELGLFGRRLVEQRFSLAHAAQKAEETYQFALRNKRSTRRQLTDAARCTVLLAGHKLQRRCQRLAGIGATEDSNDRARISSILSPGRVNRTACPADNRSNTALQRASSGMRQQQDA